MSLAFLFMLLHPDIQKKAQEEIDKVGTTLVINLRGAFLTTEAGWEDPKIFNPKRFIKNGRLSIPKNFMGFGLGKRRCLGESLAKAHMFLIFAGLLQTFNFEAIPNDPPIVEFRDRFVPSVRPFRAKITLR
ncbi:hypothetical protein RI129_011442 [Pyrocoelia pectoralis]|uniref:Cytochrome P450 n=1 Tax=Pyrocoelia pectoralis TaxID=417401 RepID=A0AAN7V816_9COLE